MMQEYDVFRVESHTDGPVTKPCQTQCNEKDQRGDCERPFLNDTIFSLLVLTN